MHYSLSLEMSAEFLAALQGSSGVPLPLCNSVPHLPNSYNSLFCYAVCTEEGIIKDGKHKYTLGLLFELYCNVLKNIEQYFIVSILERVTENNVSK